MGWGLQVGQLSMYFLTKPYPPSPPLLLHQTQSSLCCSQWGYKCHQQNSSSSSQAHFCLKPSSRDFFFRICWAPELSSYHKKGNKSFCLPCASVLPRPVAVSETLCLSWRSLSTGLTAASPGSAARGRAEDWFCLFVK